MQGLNYFSPDKFLGAAREIFGGKFKILVGVSLDAICSQGQEYEYEYEYERTPAVCQNKQRQTKQRCKSTFERGY